MPTGYTAALYNGKEVGFDWFAMQCARAFGALVTMREDPLDAPIPEKLIPDEWHLEQWQEYYQKLEEIEGWSDKKAEEEAEKAHSKAVQARSKYIVENAALSKRYNDMLVKVRAWTPPTPDHEDFKEFMVQQLETSLKHDCGGGEEEPVKLSDAEYKTQEIEDVIWSLGYHSEEYEKEIERTKGGNKWLQDLRISLQTQ